LFVGNESTRDRNGSELFVNQGDGTFVDQAKALGLEIHRHVKGAVWGDINQDGWPDLFVSNYGQANQLFVNRQGSFEEIAVPAGVDEPGYSFTAWFWDYDQDGWQDLFVCGYDNRQPHLISSRIAKEYLGLPVKGERPRLYRNHGDETFSEVTKELGLDRLIYAMGGNFGDLDNDGYPDFYAGTGEFNLWATIPNLMMLNQSGNQFVDVTSAGGFGMIQKGHGVAFGDLDQDGDQDIYHQVGGAVESDVFHNLLFENPGFGNHWLRLKLVGTRSNRSAIGAKVEVRIETLKGERSVFHWIGTGGSFGANSLDAEIGLGKAIRILSVVVDWPTQPAYQQRFTGVDLDRAYLLTEGDPQATSLINRPFKLGEGGHE
ncbi:MAG: CRTAC1 family protein, partial [Bacteroidota bacterium]